MLVSTEKKPMKLVYNEYYKCSECDSTYHVSMLDKSELLCKDCNNVSEVPKDAQVKAQPKRGSK